MKDEKDEIITRLKEEVERWKANCKAPTPLEVSQSERLLAQDRQLQLVIRELQALEVRNKELEARMNEPQMVLWHDYCEYKSQIHDLEARNKDLKNELLVCQFHNEKFQQERLESRKVERDE